MLNEDLTPIMQELLAQMALMRAELNQLKEQAKEFTQPLRVARQTPVVSTTYRRSLTRFDLVLLDGRTKFTAQETTQAVQAKRTVNPSTTELVNNADRLVHLPSSASTVPTNSTYDLIASGDTTIHTPANVSRENVELVGVGDPCGVTSSANFGVSDNASSVGIYAQNGNVSDSRVKDASHDNEVYGVGGNTNGNGLFGPEAIGVYGQGSNYGVYGNSSNVGIYGYSSKVGVYGVGSDSGVYGTGDNVGVAGLGTRVGGIFGSYMGSLKAGSNIGVIGNAGSSLDLNGFDPETNTGIYGIARGGATNFAGYFSGNVAITGNLNTANGAFKIDHPLDPTNKYLYHASVHSPDLLNIYNGIAVLNDQGQVTVEMPDWFEALNSDWRYQLTSIGEAAPDLHILEEIKDRKFTIAGGRPDQKVSWQLTGIRQDAYAKANRIGIEEDKPETQKGKYLHPEVFSHSKVKWATS